MTEPRLPISPVTLLLDDRRERVDQVVAGRTRGLVVVLDRLGDTFNQAAVLRTCEGMGIQELHVVKHPEAGFHAHVGITQGCDKWLDLHFHKTPEACARALKEKGFEVWVSALGTGASSLTEMKFDRPMALVFGNEREGVHPDMQALADGRFWIPMRGFTQSFNVSVAVAISVTRALFWREEHLGKIGDLPGAEQAALKERFYRLSLKQRKRMP